MTDDTSNNRYKGIEFYRRLEFERKEYHTHTPYKIAQSESADILLSINRGFADKVRWKWTRMMFTVM